MLHFFLLKIGCYYLQKYFSIKAVKNIFNLISILRYTRAVWKLRGKWERWNHWRISRLCSVSSISWKNTNQFQPDRPISMCALVSIEEVEVPFPSWQLTTPHTSAVVVANLMEIEFSWAETSGNFSDLKKAYYSEGINKVNRRI